MSLGSVPRVRKSIKGEYNKKENAKYLNYVLELKRVLSSGCGTCLDYQLCLQNCLDSLFPNTFSDPVTTARQSMNPYCGI